MLALPVVFAEVGGYAGTLDLSSRTETRIRATQGDPNSPAVDFVQSGTARLGLADRQWSHFVSYTPVFTAPSIFQGTPTLLFHAGAIGTSWQHRQVRIALTQDGNYGQQNAVLATTVAPGANGQTPTAQIAAAPQTLSFGFSRTALLSAVALDRQTNLTISAAYLIQGGLDDTSRGVFPLQQGPRVEATLAEATSRVDTLETQLVGQASRSTQAACPAVVIANLPPNPDPTAAPPQCDPSSQIGFATEAWRHKFSSSVTASAAAGVGVFRSRTLVTDPDYQTSVTPVVVTSLIYEARAGQETLPDAAAPEARLLRLDAQLTPVVDIRSGTSDARAQLVGTATFPYGGTLLTGRVWAMQSIETVLVRPLTLFRGEVEVQERVTPAVAYGVGVRADVQHQEPFGSFSTAVVFGQLTLTAPTTRF